jgi:hypothetical protein
VLVVAALGGCRTAARIKEVPRVDLELQAGGNRGYLIGSPPPPGEMKTTRQMVATDIEIPTWYRPKASGQPVRVDIPAPAEPVIADVTQPAWNPPAQFDSYTVQKGDSLWSIAAKPEIYGRATQWRRIFDANRDLLKGPDQLKAGMTLRIPRGDDGGMTYTDEGPQKK